MVAALASKMMVFVLVIACSRADDVEPGSPPRVPAMFVFGDSLIDVGNNNYLNSIVKSNYWPYGCDFSTGPTGRFCNGKTVVDIISELLGLAYPPAFADPTKVGARVLGGVNYASAAAGILDETGRHWGDRYTLSQQVLNFESTLDQLRNLMGARNLSQYLARSIAFLSFGSNDYLNNYLLPSLYYSSYTYSPPDFANLLLNRYTEQILTLYNVGLRKFFIAGVGPIGCIPYERATGEAPAGHCVDSVNQMLGTFNDGLQSLVTKLNSKHRCATFVYGNTYGAVGDILHNPATYGFTVGDKGCCSQVLGTNQGQAVCLPNAVPCPNRSEYVFWDSFHTSEAANSILAHRAFTGPPSDCNPINLQQLALI
ncbi:hypothetical protein Ancab_036327 [Ancistrocladus abbreviatus]